MNDSPVESTPSAGNREWRNLSAEKALAVAGEAVQDAQLKTIRFAEGSFQRSDGNEADSVGKVSVNSQQVFALDDAGIWVKTTYSTTGTIRVGEEILSLQLRASIEARYEFPEGTDEFHRIVVGKINAIMNTWPYYREFVQTTTTRMALQNPVTLPLVLAPHASAMAGFQVPGTAAIER